MLLLVANGTPILAASVFRGWGAHPLDGGRRLADGRRLLGDSKTWRGFVLAPVVTGLVALPLPLPVSVGATVGAGAMLGDLLSSFCKRRLHMASSSMAPGLDQIPEALLPLLLVADHLALSWSAIGWTVVGFIVLELILSPIFFWLGIRNRPY